MNELPYDQIGSWSEIKLDIIREYASTYSTILSKQSHIRRHVYIDAFAGYGIHVSRNTGQFVAGSPTNALMIDPPFSEFHFIDLDDKRVQSLQEIAAKRPDVHVHHGDCNDILLSKVFPRCEYNDFARGLCLLDPYGLHINWQVVATAGRMGSIEVFYNFMIMDANMNVFLKNPDKTPQREIDRMNSVWGDESWRNVAYRKQKGLFGEVEDKETNKRIAEAFQKRLREKAGFKYVADPLAIRNSTGATVYYLFFASPNKTGGKIVSDIFKKYESRT